MGFDMATTWHSRKRCRVRHRPRHARRKRRRRLRIRDIKLGGAYSLAEAAHALRFAAGDVEHLQDRIHDLLPRLMLCPESSVQMKGRIGSSPAQPIEAL